MTDLSRASASDDGVARRTILAGAAWSIPVIATATVAPAASASGTLALAFDKAAYNGTACSTITGAYVTVTNGGVPVAGVSVTVTLSDGYTFSGGASSATGVSDGTGRFALPDVTVPAAGGTASMAATDGATTASATLSAAAVLDGVPKNGSLTLTGLPSGVTATQITRQNVAGTGAIHYVLASDGKIYKSSNGTTLTATSWGSNAKDGSLYATPDSDAVAWITTAGVPKNGSFTLTGLPSGVTATQITRQNVAGTGAIHYVLASDGKIYKSSNGTTLTATSWGSNAKDGSLYATPDSDAVAWITTAGVPRNGSFTLTGLPSGVTATQITRQNVAGTGAIHYVLASDGKIYKSSNGTTLTATSWGSNAKDGSLYATPDSDAVAWIKQAACS